MSVARTVAVWTLLGLAALVTLVSSIGVVAMREPLARLHYVAAPASASFLVLAAQLVDGADRASCVKMLVLSLVLALLNGVVTHATARAAFVHARGKWPPDPPEPGGAA